MSKSFSVEKLRVKLRSFLNDSLSKLRNLKDASIKHPFIIALLLSVFAHAIALAIPIFSEDTRNGETTEQLDSEEDSEENFEGDSEEDFEDDLEDENLEEDDEPLDVDELPPLPEDDDLSDDSLDSEDDSDDDTLDSEDDSDDDTLDSGDDLGDDTLDSGDDSDDDTLDSGGDSGDDLSDDTSDPVDDSSDDIVDSPAPSEPEFEPEVDISNNIPEPPDDSGDTSDSTPETEDNTEELPSSNVETDENNSEEAPEEPVKTTQLDPTLFGQVTEYKNARPLLCGLKIAEEDKNSRLTSDPIGQVSGYFAQSLAKKGYQPKLVTDSPDTKVYQISKEGQDGYLHLFEQSSKGTVILLSQERIDCNRLNIQSLIPDNSGELEQPEEEKTQELKQSELIQKLKESKETQELKKIELVQKLKKSEVTEKTEEEKVFEKTFANLYEELGWTKDTVTAKADEKQSPNPGIETVFNADVNETPDDLASVVKTKLEEQGFETSQIEDYADGVLYEVKKGEFTKYITFTSNADENKVTIVTWKTSPTDSTKG